MSDALFPSPDVRVGCAALRTALGVSSPEALHATVAAHGPNCTPARFVAWCRHHSIIPTVYRTLTAVSHPAAGPLRDALAPPSQAIAGAGLLQAQALTEILQLFADRAINVIPLKGIHLDVRAYGGPGQRKDGDHDLLIRPAKMKDAVAALHEIGYRYSDPERPVETWDAVRIHHGPPLVKQEGPMPSWVELHWNLAPDTEGLYLHAPDQLTSEVWKRSRAATLLGAPIRELAPEDDVMHLALHAIRHMAQHTRGLSVRLSMLEDLARRMASLPDLDAACVQQRTESLGRVAVLGPLRYLWTAVLGAPHGTLFADDAYSIAPWPRRRWERALLPHRLLLADPVPGWPDAGRSFHYEKALCLVIHLLLLETARDRWDVLWRDGLQPLCAVNERDRTLAPALPDVALLPIRWLRLGWRAVRG